MNETRGKPGLPFFPLHVMALQTKCLVTAQLQFRLVIGAMRRMTGDTCRHLPVSRINDLLPDRMRKLPLGFMTVDADLIAVALQHGKCICAVHIMTCIALLDIVSMDKLTFRVSLECIIMAISAQYCLLGFKKQFIISGMGSVAVHAAVAAAFRQMVMGGKQKAGYFIMTGEACFLADFFLAAFMAGTAIVRERLMFDIADHGSPVAAVGTMAGKTAFDGLGEIFMHPGHLVPGMTFTAYFLSRTFQKLVIISLVRFMAEITLPPGIWLMGHLILFRQP